MASQAKFERLHNRSKRTTEKLIDRLGKGRITASDFADDFYTLLYGAHSEAWAIGRQVGGDRAKLNEDDQLLGLEIADNETEYLNSFINDIEDGRYTDADGNLKIGAVKQRANLYLGKLRGTANEAFVSASDPDDQFDWRMSAIEHCDDCPRFASLSPFNADELYAYPGSGDTECMTNCKCYLVRKSDGKSSIKPVEK